MVIWGRVDYLRAYRQLSGPNVYHKLDHNPTQLFCFYGRGQCSEKCVPKWQNWPICQGFAFRTGMQNTRTWSTTKDPQERPSSKRQTIHYCQQWTNLMYLSAHFVVQFLNPPTIELPSFIKDTTHFLQTLEDLGKLPEGCILASFDMTSLYTNIDHCSGLQSTTDTFNWSRLGPGFKPTNASSLKLLNLVLTPNNFQFNGQNYLQISGSAMGTYHHST